MEVFFFNVYTLHNLLSFSGLVCRLDHDRQCQLIAFDLGSVSQSKISKLASYVTKMEFKLSYVAMTTDTTDQTYTP